MNHPNPQINRNIINTGQPSFGNAPGGIPEKQPEVLFFLNELEHGLERLGKSLCQLEGRLGSITRCSEPVNNEKSSELPEADTKLAGQIRNYHSAVQSLIEKSESLIAHLEI